VRDSEVTEMPGEIGAELVTVVGLHALDGHGEPWRTSSTKAIAFGMELCV
jgi:hypothetical protein